MSRTNSDSLDSLPTCQKLVRRGDALMRCGYVGQCPTHGSIEPNIIVTLTLEQADELQDLLGERPHREEWSKQVWMNIRDRIDEARGR